MKTKKLAANLEPIEISIAFASPLARLAGKPSYQSVCDKGCPFFFILQCILMDFPAIPKSYAPGTLGFTVNGAAPAMDYAMHDGDRVEFFVWDQPSVLHA